MRKIIFTTMAATLAFAGCTKDNFTGNQLKINSILASMEQTRSHLEGGSKVVWDKDDNIDVFFNDGGAWKSSVFTAAEEGASVPFKGDGITYGDGVYAMYPADAAAKMEIPGTVSTSISSAEQAVADGTYAAGINIAIGKSLSDKEIRFANVGSLLKFRLTQERADTISRIVICANGGESIAAEGTVSVAWNDGQASVSPDDGCGSGNITLTPAAGAFNTGDTYYVWVLPGVYDKGISITLFSKSGLEAKKAGTSALTAQRSGVMDLGEIGGLDFKERETVKMSLTFDFTTKPGEDWPTADKWKDAPGDSTCIFNLDGVAYKFILTDVGGATAARVCWNEKGYVVLLASSRYLGLPAIEGWRLIRFSGVHATGNSSKRFGAITTKVRESTTDTEEYAPGGEPFGWAVQGETYVYNLHDTEAGKVYYFACTGGGIGISTMTLTYEQVTEP
ncbi:MAG: hypothetical protein ACI3ZC_06890 [Candidatus Cryptobacteroides sp.]